RPSSISPPTTAKGTRSTRSTRRGSSSGSKETGSTPAPCARGRLRSSRRRPRSAATTPVPAAAGRNTSSATSRRDDVKILSWNVNGIRAAQKKGFLTWLAKEKPDVLCLQEIKARPEQLAPELREPKGYHAVHTPAKRPGYSGTAIYSRAKPDEVWTGVGDARFDDEGRVTGIRFGNLHVISAYFPNSQEAGARLS